MNWLPVFCGKDCGGDACPLLAALENGRVQRVINNPAGGKYLKGCRRGFRLPEETYSPDRLLAPLVRVGPRGSGQFREASWEEALSLTANRLGEIRSKYGPTAILSMGSAGSTGAMHATYALLARFLNLFGGCTRLSSNYSNGAASFVLPYLFGEDWTRSGFDPATIQQSEMIILWGANLLETRFGSEVPQRLVEAKKRGAQIVVIDPRRSLTVRQMATRWLPVRPGSDAALMLAVLYVLQEDGLVDRAFVNAHSTGFDRLEAYVRGGASGPACTPEWAAVICGLPATEIRWFAHAYAAARPAMLFPGYSIQRVFAGEEPYRLAVALQIATGNFGRPGGSTGSINSLLPGPKVGRLPIPPIPGQPHLPVLRWPDAILEGRAGGYPADIHAAYILGGNYLNQGSDIRKNLAAFDRLEFAVTHELFLTPTAQYCDVVFPAATALEKEDIAWPWAGNYLLYKPQVLSPRGQARCDYDIFCDLAGRLGFLAEFSEGRSAAEWIQHFLDQSEVPDQAAFRSTGIYLAPEQARVGLADFAIDPNGHPLRTPSGKVEIASDRYALETGFPAIPTWQAPPDDLAYPLSLISPKSGYRTHSQGGRLLPDRLLAGDPQAPAHYLELHPQDASARGIAEGDWVCLFNERGRIQLPAHLTGDIMPGVVCLPEGVWVNLAASGQDTAGAANMLTSTQGSAPSTACIMHAVRVQVLRAGPLPVSGAMP